MPLMDKIQWVRAGAAVLLGAASTLVNAESGAKRELVFLNWADYLEPELIQAFEARCDCKLTQVYFENDDHRDELMLASEGANYDVLLVNGAMLSTYRKRNWLAPVPKQGVDNLRHLDPRWRDAFHTATEFAAPYFWGTLGIAYRKDLVAQPITSWQQLFQPAEELRGKIRMIKSARDLLSGALKAQGASLNATDPKVLKQAEKLLLGQRPNVRSYTYVSVAEDSELVTGDAAAALMFSGDALMAKEHNDNIEYVLPEEGGQLWVDYLAVSQRSTRKDLAWAFVDFLNEPQNAAKNAEFVYYATPNLEAEKLLPTEFLEDPVIYPSAEALKHSEFYKELPPRVERRYGDIFTRVVE